MWVPRHQGQRYPRRTGPPWPRICRARRRAVLLLAKRALPWQAAR